MIQGAFADAAPRNLPGSGFPWISFRLGTRGKGRDEIVKRRRSRGQRILGHPRTIGASVSQLFFVLSWTLPGMATAAEPPASSPVADYPQSSTHLMNVLDEDGDQRLDFEEFVRVTSGTLTFSDYDQDSNGFVDVGEMEVIVRTVSPFRPYHSGYRRHVDRESVFRPGRAAIDPARPGLDLDRSAVLRSDDTPVGRDPWNAEVLREDHDRLALGYFNGGRNTLIGRAYFAQQLDEGDLRVDLRVTTDLGQGRFHTLPDNLNDFVAAKRMHRYMGRTTGPQILEEMKAGRLDGGFIGEGSFLQAISEGHDLVAIVLMGRDSPDAPGKMLALRTGVEVNSPEDLKGLSLVTRESGPSDAVFLKEYLRSQGLAPGEVAVDDQVPPDELERGLVLGRYDGAFLHLHIASRLVKRGLVYRFRDFDWINPELSFAVLAVHRDVLRTKGPVLEQLLLRYKQRIDYEHALPDEVRREFEGSKLLGMDLRYFEGMNLPQYPPVPLVSVRDLSLVDSLMVEHGAYVRSVDVASHVDNSIMERVLGRIESGEVSPLPPDHLRAMIGGKGWQNSTDAPHGESFDD